MFVLSGLGLAYGDISFRALERLKNVSRIYMENYTSTIDKRYVDFIEKYTGKKIEEVKRISLEDDAKKFISAAKDADIALLVPGDPLVATTHHILLDEAKENNIAFEIYHSSSIFSAAIGESGLDIYKFGPVTTIPFWTDKYKPTSFIDVISKNLSNGEHTLVLLDFDSRRNASMGLHEAISELKAANSTYARKPLGDDSLIIVLNEIGRERSTIKAVSLENAIDLTVEEGTSCLIIPAKMNFAEEKAIDRFK
ncbi:MAG: diphthine synthase [Candidatus Micrarchaeia archaeon]